MMDSFETPMVLSLLVCDTVITDAQSGKKTLVIYSLGNFISTQLKAVNMVGNIVTKLP